MKRVFTASTMSADQEIVKELPDEADIPCLIRNEQLAMALSELTPMDSAPEVWTIWTFRCVNTVAYPKPPALWSEPQPDMVA